MLHYMRRRQNIILTTEDVYSLYIYIYISFKKVNKNKGTLVSDYM